MSIDADLWAKARQVCTPAELRALRKREDLARAGEFTWARLGEALDSTAAAARARVLRAEEKINQGDGPVLCANPSPINGEPCHLPAGHEGWCAATWGPKG